MKDIFKFCFAMIILLFSSFSINGQKDCGQVLKGLYDYSLNEFDEGFWERYIKQIDEMKFNSFKQFKEHNTSVGVSIPIKAIPVSFDFGSGGTVNSDGQQYSTFREFIDRNTEFSRSFKNEFRTLNKEAVEAWVKCMSEKQFISWTTINGDYLHVHLQRGAGTEPRVLKVSRVQYSGDNLDLEQKNRHSLG